MVVPKKEAGTRDDSYASVTKALVVLAISLHRLVLPLYRLLYMLTLPLALAYCLIDLFVWQVRRRIV